MNYRMKLAKAEAYALGATHYIFHGVGRPPHLMHFLKEGRKAGTSEEVAGLWVGSKGRLPAFPKLTTDFAGLQYDHPLVDGIMRKLLPPLSFLVTYHDVTWVGDDEYEEEHGELSLEVADTFQDIIQLVRQYGFTEWSTRPYQPGGHGWLTGDQGEADFSTGRNRQTAVHPRNGRARRYLEKAARVEGVV